MITEIALKIIIVSIAFYLMVEVLKSIILLIQEVKDKIFLDYLKDNEPQKYEDIAIRYQDNPVKMKTVLHAYHQKWKKDSNNA